MRDGEGALGDADEAKRKTAVENHYKWVEAAKYLGCHSIRVNAQSSGSYEDVVSSRYPLARFLYIYVNKAPGKPLDPVVREFLKFVFSREGQEIVLKDGYYPLPASVVKEELAKIQ